MVNDHGKANDELRQLAASKGIPLPLSPPKDAKAHQLESMNGSTFERAYMAEMLADHKKDIALFETQSRSNGGDPDINAFATKTLPTLKDHLQRVQADQDGAAASGVSTKH